MLTLKSSLNTYHSHLCGLLVACAVHIPVVFFALHAIPLKIEAMPANPINSSLEFSLASFVPQESVEESVSVTRTKEPAVTKQPTPKPILRKKPKQVVPQQKATQDSHTPIKQESSRQEPITLGSGRVNNPFLSEVKRLIDSHHSYPRSARRMGLSGEVIVRLILGKDGKITELKILESSTHAILDNQTLKAIKDASRFFPKPDKVYVLDIPIEYRLQRG